MNRTTWKTTATQTYPRWQAWRQPPTTWELYNRPSRLGTLAESFEPISLTQMEAAALLNRTDTKFVLTAGQLLTALTAVQPDYWMLAVNGQRLNHYRTLYFDTPDFALYTMHVNGRSERYKVRSREYADTHLAFLEVKHKTNTGRTIKERISTAQPVVQMTVETEDWLQDTFPYNSRALEAKLWNTFTRLTLVSKRHCERVTLDVNLSFHTPERVKHLEGIAIAEVKLDAASQASPFLAQMRAQRVRPRGCSKYCLGVAMLYDQVKKNALKPKLLWLEKIVRQGCTL
jgi:hypothetical protein